MITLLVISIITLIIGVGSMIYAGEKVTDTDLRERIQSKAIILIITSLAGFAYLIFGR